MSVLDASPVMVELTARTAAGEEESYVCEFRPREPRTVAEVLAALMGTIEELAK